jgi:hypothetical protein
MVARESLGGAMHEDEGEGTSICYAENLEDLDGLEEELQVRTLPRAKVHIRSM